MAMLNNQRVNPIQTHIFFWLIPWNPQRDGTRDVRDQVPSGDKRIVCRERSITTTAGHSGEISCRWRRETGSVIVFHGVSIYRGYPNSWMLICLVVWNIFVFPYTGNNTPKWLIFFTGVETTNQLLNNSKNPKIYRMDDVGYPLF